MRRAFVVLSLLGLLGPAGCGPTQIPPAQNYATVAGRVYDASTNAPVAGAVVHVDFVNTVTTGPDGSYVANNVPLGQTDVCVDAPSGYAPPPCPVTASFSLGAGQRFQLDIPLTHR
jgi:hypothetical protein